MLRRFFKVISLIHGLGLSNLLILVVTLSVLYGLLVLVSGVLIPEVLLGNVQAWYVILLFITSLVLSIYLEYFTQRVIGKITLAHLEFDFKRTYFFEDDIMLREPYSDDLSTGLERIRTDLYLPVVQFMYRSSVLVVAFVCLLLYNPYVIALALGVALFIAPLLLLSIKIARVVDQKLSSSMFELANTTHSIVSNYTFLRLVNFGDRVFSRFSVAYQEYIIGRGLNAINSQLPRYIIDLLILILVVFSVSAKGLISPFVTDFAAFGFIALRLNPFFQGAFKAFNLFSSTSNIDLKRGFKESHTLCHRIPIPVSGQCVILSGESGVGKTTSVLNALSALEGGSNIFKVTANQDVYSLLPYFEQEFFHSYHFKFLLGAEFDINSRSNLSNGEGVRVLIAYALFKLANFLFIDEAISALDVQARMKVFSVLNDALVPLIIISHEAIPYDKLYSYDIICHEVRR